MVKIKLPHTHTPLHMCTHVLSLSLLTRPVCTWLSGICFPLSPWPLLQALLSLAWLIPAPLLLPNPTTSHHYCLSLLQPKSVNAFNHATSLIKTIRIASKHLNKVYKILLSPLSLSHATFPQHWKLQSYSTVSLCPTAVPLALGPLAGAVHSSQHLALVHVSAFPSPESLPHHPPQKSGSVAPVTYSHSSHIPQYNTY